MIVRSVSIAAGVDVVVDADGHVAFAAPGLAPPIAGSARDGRAGRIRGCRQHIGEGPHRRLEARIRKRGGIGGGLRLGQDRRGALHERGDIEIGLRPVERAPRLESRSRRRFCGGERGIHHDQAAEAVGHRHRQCQADQPAPILTDQRDVRQVQCLYQVEQRVAVKVETVRGLVHRLVRTAEADQVGCDYPAGRGEYRDHLAIEVGPRRLAVQAQEHGASPRPFIDEMHPQSCDAGQIMRIERIAGQIGETVVGCAERGD